jgi:hypothetical protein
MKSAIKLAVAACVGALVAFAIPLNVLNSTISTAQELGVRVSKVRLADFNPLPAVEVRLAALNPLPAVEARLAALNPLPAIEARLAAFNPLPAAEGWLATLNPLRGVVDWEKDKMLAGEALAKLGFQAPAVTFKPTSIPTMSSIPAASSHVDAGEISGTGIYSDMQYQLDPNSRRMNDTGAHMNTPAESDDAEER